MQCEEESADVGLERVTADFSLFSHHRLCLGWCANQQLRHVLGLNRVGCCHRPMHQALPSFAARS